jgi:HK97 gp10 family phage protein
MEMATIVKVEFEGARELKDLFQQIEKDFGEKDAQNILRNAVRKSMKPVLLTARTLAPKDTGALAASLQVETRKPSNKDKRSKYVDLNDVVIGAVTTASGKKLAKGLRLYDTEASYKAKKDVYKNVSVQSDARTIAMELGTAKTPSQPYLRPALESSAASVTGSLGDSLKFSLEKYKAKQAKRVKL